MLNVIGPRALLKPIETPPKGLVVLTDRAVPVLGQVMSLGRAPCPDCGTSYVPDLEIGALVLIPPAAGQTVTVDGEAYWLVATADILAEWTKEPV